jgi:hypothetical protein
MSSGSWVPFIQLSGEATQADELTVSIKEPILKREGSRIRVHCTLSSDRVRTATP